MLLLTPTVKAIVHISNSVLPVSCVTTWKLRRRKHQKPEYHQTYESPPHHSLDFNPFVNMLYDLFLPIHILRKTLFLELKQSY